MVRTVLLEIILFATPFVLYAAYAAFVNKQRALSGETWNDAPIILLTATGTILIGAGLIYWNLTDQSETEATYTPHWEIERSNRTLPKRPDQFGTP
jgi:hypothetical protein